MRIDPKELIEIICGLEKNAIDCSELSVWAVGKIEKGIETKSLILMAGLTTPETEEVKQLLRDLVIKELGFQYPSEEIIELAFARNIARRIFKKEIQPNEGCSLIGEINHILDWPESLSEFGLLAHNQTDH